MGSDQDELLLDDEKVLLDEEIELLDDEELLFDEDEKLTEDELPDEDAELAEEELSAEDEAVEEAVIKTKRPIGKGERMQAFVLDFLTFFFGAVFIICLTEIIFYYAGSYRYRKDIDKLNQAIGGGIATELNYDLLCRNHDIRIFPDGKAHDLVGYVSSFPAPRTRPATRPTLGKPHAPFALQGVDQRIDGGGRERVAADQQRMEGKV